MKSVGALKANRNGKYFEKLIEISCLWYLKMRIADIKKTPEPMRPVAVLDRKRGHYKAIYTKAAQPDFTGTIKGGRAILFEAKHTERTNLPFDRISKEQEKDLNMKNELGALCLVLISFKAKNFYAVPWDFFCMKKINSSKKSLNEIDIAEWKIKFEDGRLKFLEN